MLSNAASTLPMRRSWVISISTTLVLVLVISLSSPTIARLASPSSLRMTALVFSSSLCKVSLRKSSSRWFCCYRWAMICSMQVCCRCNSSRRTLLLSQIIDSLSLSSIYPIDFPRPASMASTLSSPGSSESPCIINKYGLVNSL
jgi:hypothetical protein